MGRTFKTSSGSQEPDDSILKQQQEHDDKRDILILDEDGGFGDAVANDIASDLFGEAEDDDDEQVESLAFELSDGRTVVMKALGGFEGFRIDKIFADQPLAQNSRQYATALLHVVEVAGEHIGKIQDKPKLFALANKLGHKGVEQVSYAYVKHFAAGPKLRNVKKNLL